MTSAEQKLAIKEHIQEIYSFAYALIPDQLQAKQLVIDALCAGVTETSLENYLQDRLLYLKNLYKLSKRRFPQVQDSIEKTKGFWELSLNERAVLFLKYKYELDSESIGVVLSLDHSQVVSAMHQGKKDFFASQGFSTIQDFSFL